MNARIRSGLTLIELLVGILVGGAVLASAATLMSRTLAANSTAATHLHSIQAIGELGRQFRADVHQATSVDIAQDQPRLTIDLDDGSRVAYQASSAGVAREQTWAGQPPRREAYALGAFELLEVRRDGASPALQLVLGRVATHDDATIVQGCFAITAMPGAEL
jgi:prepilin-type N-terminal cleavage/methylation domain-containing protein